MYLSKYKNAFLAVFLTSIMTGILTVTQCVNTQAATNTNKYKFADIDLVVEVPDSLISFTRSTTNNNSYLELIGASDAAEVRTAMVNSSCYLEAVDKDMTYEIAITGQKANETLHDFNTLNDTELNDLYNEYVESQKNLTPDQKTEEILDSEIVYYNDLAYFKTDIKSLTDDGVLVYATKYFTVNKGYIYNFAVQTNTSSITTEMTDNMDLLLNSAKYTAVAASILDNGIVSETISIVITAAIPIIILALIVYFIRIGNKKKQNQLIKEELELKKKRGL